MMMAPAHWTSRSAPQAWLLLPISWLYRLLMLLRLSAVNPVALGVPVLCVGNNTVGGAGKTPTAIALCHLLIAMGKHPHVISRGYKGNYTSPVVRVDPDTHTAAEVGDEPLLIARHAPCWVAKRRLNAAHAAIAAGAYIIVMDDGLQNPSIVKDFTILVVDGSYGFGNRFMMPAGPCREPVRISMKKADAVLIMGEETNAAIRCNVPSHVPIFTGRLIPDSSLSLKDKQVYAFAGIAHPDKFFATLAQMGATMVHTAYFADHHHFSTAELQRLAQEASEQQAQLVTTEKDFVRLPETFRKQVIAVPVLLDLDHKDAFNSLLQNQVIG